MLHVANLHFMLLLGLLLALTQFDQTPWQVRQYDSYAEVTPKSWREFVARNRLARLAPAEKWLVKWPTLLYFVHRESPHIHTFTHKSHTKTPHRAMSHFTSTYQSIYKPKNINFHFQTDHRNITSPDKKNRQQKSVLRPLKYSHIVEPIARNSETGPDHPIAVECHSFFFKSCFPCLQPLLLPLE